MSAHDRPGLSGAALARAIESGDLRLHFQPSIDLNDGSVVGLEALVRWQHEAFGLLAPDAFLGLAQRTSLLAPIGEWVINEAARVAAEVNAGRVTPLRVWVNMATAQLDDADRLLAVLEGALSDHQIDSRCLGVEVTESSLVSDLDDAVRVLHRIRNKGIEVALDDFGTGYSSMTYLRRLPVTAVKIDRSFVGSVDGSLADAAIVEAVVDLAHSLGLRAIVEGVEQLSQLEAVIRLGADRAQGYYFARPVPADDLGPLIAMPWCGAGPPNLTRRSDARAADLPGFGGPRARLLLAALDAASDSVVVLAPALGPDGPRILYANPSFERETGYRAAEVIGKSPRMFRAPECDPEAIARLENAFETGESVTVEVTNIRADGSHYPCHITMNPVHDERGVHTHWFQVRRDLTAQHEAEEALRRSVQRTEHLLAHTADMVFVSDAQGIVTYANRATLALIGREPSEVIGTMGFDYIHPDDLEEVLIRFGQLFDPEYVAPPGDTAIFRIQHADGSWIPVEVVATPLFDDPAVRGVVLSARDVRLRVFEAEAADRRLEFDRFASALAQQALDRGPEGFMTALSSTMRELGELLKVDVAYADSIDLDRGRLAIIGAWCRPDLHDELMTGGFPARLDGLEPYLEALSRVDDLRVSDPQGVTTPWEEARRAVFHKPRVSRAAVIVPLRVGGRLTGAVGVEMIDQPREWEDDEVSFLHKVADTIAQILERQRMDLALRSSEARLSALFNNAGDLFFVTDTSGRIEYCSPISLALLGRAPEALLGRQFPDLLHPDDVAKALEAFAGVQQGKRISALEVRAAHTNGTYRWFEIAGGESVDANGFVVACREITHRRLADEAAARRSRFDQFALELSQRALDQGASRFIGDLDMILAELGILLEVEACYVERLNAGLFEGVAGWTAPGVAPEAVECGEGGDAPAWLAWLEQLEPLVLEDIERADAALRADFERFPVKDRAVIAIPLAVRGELIGSLGVSMFSRTRVWIHDEVQLLRRVGETVAHIMERQRTSRALTQSQARFRLLSEQSADLVTLTDQRGRLVYVSPSSFEVLGYQPDELVGTPGLDLLVPEDRVRLDGALNRLIEGIPQRSEFRVRHKEGYAVWVANSARRIRNENGEIEFWGSMRDITERKRLEAELEFQALHDPLTGLANRTLLQSRLEVAVARRADPNPVALLLIDLDGFKDVNDAHGHLAGDVVLAEVAARLRAVIRPSDTLARMGGDEFVLLCPETPVDGAVALGERIVETVRAPFALGDELVRISASVGVAGVNTREVDPDWLLIEADRAMYDAKRAGRGCVRVAGSPQAPATA